MGLSFQIMGNSKRHLQYLMGASLLCLLCIPVHAKGEQYSTNIAGQLGLNTIPNARMDPAGTIRAGVGTLDPYLHGWLGFQIAEPLSITLRQSAEVSNLNEDADRLYPGLDFKLRILEERKYRPEIAVGVSSAIGHKRMAGEYIALSKRYRNFDFTAGLGWGRYGTAAHFDNPLKSVSTHFGGPRALDGEAPNDPHHWFTGEDIGVFAGLEYFTPLKGLSVKLDYGADRYAAEKTALGFSGPAPWSAGLNYKPVPWADIGIAMQGTDKIMGRLSLQNMLQNWKNEDADYERGATMRPYRTGLTLPGEMEAASARTKTALHNVNIDGQSVSGNLMLRPDLSTPHQFTNAAIHMANHAGPNVERIDIAPTILGLRGPSVSLIRADLERALAKNTGSPSEIWRNTEFHRPATGPADKVKRPSEYGFGLHRFKFKLDNQISLSEEDSGTLYRTSIVAGGQAPDLFGWIDNFYSLRLNLKDNLDRLEDIRPRVILPVRSNVDQFAERTVAVDTLFSAFTHSFRSDLHLSVMGGYLEEMYAGGGGELLFRPFNSRFALGAESWLALKRDPDSSLNLGLNGDRLISAHVNGYYDLPFWDVTAHAKFGRYLAEDIGGTLGLEKRFHNGAKLAGYITVTDQSDFDLFGGTTHADHGIRLSLPLGGFKHVPRGTSIDTKLAPFGRDIGQSIENPLPLYDVTERFNARHMAEYWSDITE